MNQTHSFELVYDYTVIRPCKIECKEKVCQFESTVGRVRDYPEVGILVCTECRIRIHSSNLQEQVDYRTSSMWKTGHNSNLLELKSRLRSIDISRRSKAIIQLGKEYRKKKLLDFGCGSGELMNSLQEYFSVEGLEIEEESQKKLKSDGHKYFTSLDEVESSRYEIVTAIHVVEHFEDVKPVISNIRDVLQTGGLLVIETPNSQDILIEDYNCKPFQEFTFWSHHPVLHTNYSLGRILENAGFKILVNSGIQRYGLRNHLYWILRGLPGGHEKLEILDSTELESHYSQQLIMNEKMDTLWIVAQKG
jgi:2-polyprenyl-3-methyl-5-hydroxy-6-metoxy-1,4-benzoquinol methylase